MPRRKEILSHRNRVLTEISVLYAMRKRLKAGAIVQRELRRGKLAPKFFSELFIHLSLFLGYPAMLEGLEKVAELSPHGKRSSLSARGSAAHKHGKRILERIYGEQTPKLLRRLDGLYPGLGHRIMQDAYGLIMNRDGLTLSERELANVIVLFTHSFDRQLYSHLRGAIRVGVSKNTLKRVIGLTADIMGKASQQTLRTIDKLSTE
jgi:4-carboxymuconolactone decarboxylase